MFCLNFKCESVSVKIVNTVVKFTQYCKFFGHKVTSAENYSQRLADWNPPFGTSGENIKLCKHSNTQ